MFMDVGYVDDFGIGLGVMMMNSFMMMVDIMDGCLNMFIIIEDVGCLEFWMKFGKGLLNNNLGGGNFLVMNGIVCGVSWVDLVSSILIYGFSEDGFSVFGLCVINCINNNEVFSFYVIGLNVFFVDGWV